MVITISQAKNPSLGGELFLHNFKFEYFSKIVKFDEIFPFVVLPMLQIDYK
jgi:hypothetical protein